jgi:hypothetical protein
MVNIGYLFLNLSFYLYKSTAKAEWRYSMLPPILGNAVNLKAFAMQLSQVLVLKQDLSVFSSSTNPGN